MAGPLTYPPEIVIESTIELPLEYYVPEQGGIGGEVCGELTVVVIELVIELLSGGS
jgi:hypothetical protein